MYNKLILHSVTFCHSRSIHCRTGCPRFVSCVD